MTSPRPPSDDDDLSARIAQAHGDDDELAVEVDDVAVMALLKGLDEEGDIPAAPEFMSEASLAEDDGAHIARMAALAATQNQLPDDVAAEQISSVTRRRPARRSAAATPAPTEETVALPDDLAEADAFAAAVDLPDDLPPADEMFGGDTAGYVSEEPVYTPPPAPMMSLPLSDFLDDEPVVEEMPPEDAEALRARRYMFDLDFGAEPKPPEPEPEPLPEPVTEFVPPGPSEPPTPMFSAEEMQAARAAAYADGEARGMQVAMASIEQKLARALEVIGAQLPGLQDDRSEIVNSVSGEAARLAHAMVGHLFPELARRYGFTEIETVIASSLEQAIDQPRIIIRVHADLAEAIAQQAEHMATMAGYAGRVSVLPDSALGPSDVRVEWGDGGAERLVARAWDDISDIVGRAVTQLGETLPESGKTGRTAA
jgi:flagellar assembly protein FliH